MVSFFVEHPGAEAASYDIAEWVMRRWPKCTPPITRKMAYSALHYLASIGEVERVGESCAFRLVTTPDKPTGD